MKKHPIVLLMISFVLLTTAFAPKAEAQKLSSTEGKMSIKFPADYQASEEGPTKKFTATVGDQTFFAAYTVHEVELEDQMGLAEVSLDEFNKILEGNILEKSNWKLKKNTGLKANIHLEKQDGKILYHVILIGNIQYQVVVISPTESFDQKSADKFVKSFKVKK